MEARNRDMQDWYGKIKRGEIKLPRFQRFEEWDRHRICSLLEAVIHNLPLGITLVLEVGDQEKFISRFLETAPQNGGRVYEQLLDGQQRLHFGGRFTTITTGKPTSSISRRSITTTKMKTAKTCRSFSGDGILKRTEKSIRFGVMIRRNV
ncbi:MAG: DUF262 domain-containing protein [Syntrophales bacterium]|jgi:hypothetical protein|nr:DUF262 domain-containing protein [Syntrophales bacterium]